jgi:hypothetical protein
MSESRETSKAQTEPEEFEAQASPVASEGDNGRGHTERHVDRQARNALVITRYPGGKKFKLGWIEEYLGMARRYVEGLAYRGLRRCRERVRGNWRSWREIERLCGTPVVACCRST